MQKILLNISIKINEKIYMKDPETSDLGSKIVSESIDMIDSLGFEAYTFRKLAEKIKSTEASIYRYFESKHKLLLYLFNWYWGWMEYRLEFQIANIDSPQEKLKRVLGLLTDKITNESQTTPFNVAKLYNIIMIESSKTYLNKHVDDENKEGVYSTYKNFVSRVSYIILEINPAYRYPHMLVSTIIEGIHHERFFADHLPTLTDSHKGEDSVSEFYRELLFKAINVKDE